jgi:hypothetical protein
MDSLFLKMQRYCLKDILAELIPSLGFRKNGVSERTSTIATFLGVANLEDQLQV